MLNFELPKFLGAIVAGAPGAGDVLLAVGCPPQVQIDGALVPMPAAGLDRLTPYQTEAIVLHLLALAPPASAARVRQEGAAHFAYSVPGLNRFRVAVFSQRGTFAVSLRMIPERVPTLAELDLPDAMREACRERCGVVLVNGPAGCGRTTSLAAMLAEINRSRACHVVTIEDPIEFLHKHETATINQREVGVDTPSLAHGMSAAMRQGAQVVLASEVRGPDEARLLLEAAETGHLVMTTLRGVDTASALLRLLSFFPAEERGEARARLARVLRWSFTQLLLPHAVGRKAVVEVWRGTRKAAAHLAEGPLDSVTMADALREGESDGQINFDRALERRVRSGEMTVETALANALQPCLLEARLPVVGERQG